MPEFDEPTDEEADTIIENLIEFNNTFHRAERVSQRCLIATSIGATLMLENVTPLLEEYQRRMGEDAFNAMVAQVRSCLDRVLMELRK